MAALIITLLNLNSAAAGDEPQAGFTATVKGTCRLIRNTSDVIGCAVHRQSLLVTLESADHSALSEAERRLYTRAAYGLFLSNPALPANNAALLQVKRLATPVTLHEGLMCLQSPLGMLVVVEKLTLKNLAAWRQYAGYEVNDGGQSERLPDFATIQARMPEGSAKDAQMWRKYRQDRSGIIYFDFRIHAGIKPGYDKWVAYLYNGTIAELLAERHNTAIATNNMEMVMTVQASARHDCYSPMGISRTVEAAKIMRAVKIAGTVGERIETPLSIWLHALTARMFQVIYPNVRKLWTKPAHYMRVILIKALLPYESLPDVTSATDSRGLTEWDKLSREAESKIALKISTDVPDLPWGDEFEFRVNSCPSTGITIADLLLTVLPY